MWYRVMETKGRIVDVSKDWKSGKFRLTFEVDRDVSGELDALRDDLRIKAVKWRNKRSLNANAYFHVLIGKIAGAVHSSTTEVHNKMICRYGQPEIMEDRLLTVILLDSIPWEKLDYIHLKPTSATRTLDDGKLYRVYYVMRGSHTYDTKEMSVLIDGTVSEAQELGIETLTPDELERMKSAWQGKAS